MPENAYRALRGHLLVTQQLFTAVGQCRGRRSRDTSEPPSGVVAIASGKKRSKYLKRPVSISVPKSVSTSSGIRNSRRNST